MSDYDYFIAIIKPIRDDFFTDHTAEENQIISDHFEYLKQLLADEKIILAGPAVDPKSPFGLIIFKTSSFELAEEMLLADPSVKNKVQKIVELQPFVFSLSSFPK
ncbi:MAG: YciI family protein [Candidatus Kariarchaeaceae archaeon]